MHPANIESLPAEVLRCHVFAQLPAFSLTACLFVSRHFSKIIITSSSLIGALTNRQQQSLLKQLYRTGSLALLEWYNKCLKYPGIFLRNECKCLRVAAEGMNLDHKMVKNTNIDFCAQVAGSLCYNTLANSRLSQAGAPISPRVPRAAETSSC